MNRYIIQALVTVVTASITAFSAIKVAHLSSEKRAEQDHSPATINPPAAAFTADTTAGLFSPIKSGATPVVPKQDGVMIVTASGSAEGGGAFRSYLDVFIKIDGQLAGQARSYIPVNWEVGHIVNAFCIVPIFAGKPLAIELSTTGEGLKGSSTVTGRYALLSLPK